jgi:hypothetical protein
LKEQAFDVGVRLFHSLFDAGILVVVPRIPSKVAISKAWLSVDVGMEPAYQKGSSPPLVLFSLSNDLCLSSNTTLVYLQTFIHLCDLYLVSSLRYIEH